MVLTQTMKIIKSCNSMRAPRLRASPRHGGAGIGIFAINDFDIDPPRGRPFGGGGVHHK